MTLTSIFSSAAGRSASLAAGGAAAAGAGVVAAASETAAGAGAAAAGLLGVGFGLATITTINFFSSMLYLERGSSSTEETKHNLSYYDRKISIADLPSRYFFGRLRLQAKKAPTGGSDSCSRH